MKAGEERTKPVEDDTEGPSNPEHDDEFVSDSHQVSSKDLAEADEAMKKLGLGKVLYFQCPLLFTPPPPQGFKHAHYPSFFFSSLQLFVLYL